MKKRNKVKNMIHLNCNEYTEIKTGNQQSDLLSVSIYILTMRIVIEIWALLNRWNNKPVYLESKYSAD